MQAELIPKSNRPTRRPSTPPCARRNAPDDDRLLVTGSAQRQVSQTHLVEATVFIAEATRVSFPSSNAITLYWNVFQATANFVVDGVAVGECSLQLLQQVGHVVALLWSQGIR